MNSKLSCETDQLTSKGLILAWQKNDWYRSCWKTGTQLRHAARNLCIYALLYNICEKRRGPDRSQ